jgi:hypothetical protein
MIDRKEWRWVAIWAVAVIAVTTLPYVFAYITTPDDLFYSGLLSNAMDGYTYLAKMRQGERGEWLFRLPYTPEPHQGEFVYVYYLFLGHITRWTHLSAILVMHLARVANGLFLLFVMYYAASWLFEEVERRRFAFIITTLGSGLGWLAALLGGLPVDLGVPEGYVLYSLLTNAHFALGIALMILLLLWSVTPWNATRVDWRRLAGVTACTAILGLLQPFCLLTVGVVLLLYTLVRWWQKGRLPGHEIASGLVLGCVGVPLALFGYLALAQNPVLAIWAAQNQTLSPPPWDYAIGYGIVLILALFGVWQAVRRRQGRDLFLLSWVLSTAVLIYIPHSLQRRLVTGLIIPLGGLATAGWYALPARRRFKEWMIWACASLTNWFMIGIFITMILTRHHTLYLTRDEHDAFQWMADAVPQDALVVAAPQTGLYIPAWAGQRVFYGHPFETAQADVRQAQVERFFSLGERTLPYQADYVFYGPREQALQAGKWTPDLNWKVVYQKGTVTIYAVL